MAQTTCLASFGPDLTILTVHCMWSLLVVEGSRWWMTVLLALMPVYMFVVVVYITILVNLVNWRRKKHTCIHISGPSSCRVLSLFWPMLISAIIMECWGCRCCVWTRNGDVLMIVIVQVVVVLKNDISKALIFLKTQKRLTFVIMVAIAAAAPRHLASLVLNPSSSSWPSRIRWETQKRMKFNFGTRKRLEPLWAAHSNSMSYI